MGLFGLDNKDKFLILDLLTWMHEKKADYTNTFCHLMDLSPKKDELFDDNDLMNWKKRWKERLSKNNDSPNKYLELMKNNNPLVIPRNHKVEEALEAAEKNDLKPLTQLVKILKNTSPRHVPSKIIVVNDIPRTKSGKIVELAVKNIIDGNKVKNKEALANPEVLKFFKNLKELEY